MNRESRVQPPRQFWGGFLYCRKVPGGINALLWPLETSNCAASRHHQEGGRQFGITSEIYRFRRQRNGESRIIRKTGSETGKRKGRGKISGSWTGHGQSRDYNSRVVRAAIEPLGFRNLRRF